MEKTFWRKFGEATGILIPAPEVREHVYSPPVLPTREEHNRRVSQNDALSLITVYRAVSILATSAKQLSLEVFRDDTPIDVPQIIKQPNLNEPRSAFLEKTVTSLALTGDAFWRIHRVSPDAPVANIEVLDPRLVTIKQKDNGEVAHYQLGNKKLQTWQVSHLALMRRAGSPYGLGPIQAAQLTINGTIDLRDYSSNWFRDGHIPNGVLKSESQLTEDQAIEYKRRFEDAVTNHSVAVLGQNTTYQPIMLSPRDAQFLESQEFSVTDIARLFGIPASYLLTSPSGGGSETYANMQQVDIAFLKYSLSNYTREIEEALSDLRPRGQVVRMNFESLLRTDTKSRYEAFNMAIEAGWLKKSEVRAIEHLPPIEGIDDKPAPPVIAPVSQEGQAQEGEEE